MSSWYSNILTKTSSQISSLRSTLLSGDADGDTDDDTHVCRVLRNYYSDKGRPFPPWLPPDPKAPPPQATPVLYAQPAGARYGGMGAAPPPQQGGLSSLWDNGPAQNQPPQPQSLRAGRAPPSRGREDVAARPLPSQRAGSHQSVGGTAAVQGGSSAQDRLRQRLWGSGGGSRTTSPGQTGGPFQPPAPSGGGGGGGGGGSYEDRFGPGGMYDGSRGGGGGGGGRPYVGANSPWASSGDEFGGGGGGGGGRPGGQRRQGLPSGPRGYR